MERRGRGRYGESRGQMVSHSDSLIRVSHAPRCLSSSYLLMLPLLSTLHPPSLVQCHTRSPPPASAGEENAYMSVCVLSFNMASISSPELFSRQCLSSATHQSFSKLQQNSLLSNTSVFFSRCIHLSNISISPKTVRIYFFLFVLN